MRSPSLPEEGAAFVRLDDGVAAFMEVARGRNVTADSLA